MQAVDWTMWGHGLWTVDWGNTSARDIRPFFLRPSCPPDGGPRQGLGGRWASRNFLKDNWLHRKCSWDLVGPTLDVAGESSALG